MVIQYTHYFKGLVILCQAKCALLYAPCPIVEHLDYFWVLYYKQFRTHHFCTAFKNIMFPLYRIFRNETTEEKVLDVLQPLDTRW